MIDLLIKNGKIVTHNNEKIADIAIKNEKIIKIGKLVNLKSKKTIDARGLHILPGAFDTQVHFREPGNTKKENLKTGSLAAVAGGITSVFDMPNNKPSITTRNLFMKKLQTAKKRMHCNYAFYFGAEKDNIKEIKKVEKMKGCCGVKVFVGSSTGTLLVSNHADIEKIMKSTKKMISFHSENEDLLISRKKYAKKGRPLSHQVWRNVDTAITSTKKLIKSANKCKKKIHILHITTAEEIKLLLRNRKYVSFEVTPQHLVLASPECYKKLGTYAQMNPPIRDKSHYDRLWYAVKNNLNDTIGSDHAPHLKVNKDKEYPDSPSGMPGVQTIFPVMIDHVNNGKLTLNQLINLMCENPCRIFGIKNKGFIKEGFDADLTIVDMKKEVTIKDEMIASKCGWTPFNNYKVKGFPVGTIVNGILVMSDGKILVESKGKPLSF
jgi:dihydroorotase